MNTCAECRFWKDGKRQADSPDWKTCSLEAIPGARFHVIFPGENRYESGLFTRGDFGCVQFEAHPMKFTPINLSGIPVADVEVIQTSNGGSDLDYRLTGDRVEGSENALRRLGYIK